MDSIIVLKYSKQFVLSYIIEPGIKVFYRDENDLKIICSDHINGAYIFYSRDNAINISEHLKLVYGLDFTLEVVGG